MPPDMQSLSEDSGLRVLRRFRHAGFLGSFTILAGGRVRCETCRDAVGARDVRLVDSERIDTATDPDDQQLVAALVCPACGARGTAILSYGPGGSREDAESMNLFRDARRTEPYERVQDGVAVES